VTAKLASGASLALCAICTIGVATAQRGGGDWMTNGYDAQRSSWVRTDPKISPQSLAKPGFELVWKVKLANGARQLNSITPPALLDFYIGYRGFRSLAFFGTNANKVVTLDIDLARTEWEKPLVNSAPAESTLGCPGGMTSAVTRPTTTAFPAVLGGFGAGRATGAKSGVGEPHEGAVTLRPATNQPPRPPVARPKPGPTNAAPSPFSPRVQWVLALTSDGKLHHMYVSNGHEPNPPVQFLPPNANAHGLISFDGMAYVATNGGCGKVENGVWAIDLATNKVSNWKTSAVAGTAGPAADPSGKLFVSAGGGEVAALDPKSLQQLASYKAGADLTSSPVIFEFKGKNLLAVAAGGQLHLLDTADLAAGALAKAASFASATYATGALASWQDAAGVRWVLAPGDNAIMAFKVTERDGKPAFEQGWKSRELVSPIAPVVVNGVVFALSSGEYRTDDGKVTAAERVQKSKPAVLYALDGIGGKELWNSGSTITSFVDTGGLSAGGSRIYVGGQDGTQYAFSFPIEH
jgi:hypothetical protein